MSDRERDPEEWVRKLLAANGRAWDDEIVNIVRDLVRERDDLEQRFDSILNRVWKIAYPDAPESWEYPDQVPRHLRLFVEEIQRRAEANAARAESVTQERDGLAEGLEIRDGELAAAREEAAWLREALEDMEHCGGSLDDEPSCPMCECSYMDEHLHDCRVGAIADKALGRKGER